MRSWGHQVLCVCVGGMQHCGCKWGLRVCEEIVHTQSVPAGLGQGTLFLELGKEFWSSCMASGKLPNLRDFQNHK